jgi:hypothetical protein
MSPMLATLAALILQSSVQTIAKFPSQASGVCFRKMELYDSIAIVEPVRMLPEERRPDSDNRVTQDVVMRIKDATWASPGSEVTVVVQKVPSNLPLVIPSGHRYLLIARKAENGRMGFPVGDWLRAEVYGPTVRANSPDERLGLALFETQARTLPAEGSSEDRLAQALAECFVPVLGERLNDLCSFWEAS